uniref:Uncharacterized protein n=1 Tax=Panagrolaimus superbus TaxID=310955 RepID=A0A914YJ83_9BILA
MGFKTNHISTRYKNVSKTKEKEDNTEFERVKVKARPAASKKHAPGTNKNNIERLMINNNPGNPNDQEPQLKSFEETEEDLKSAKQDGPDVLSDTGAENTDPNAKSKEKITKEDQKDEIKANENACKKLC